MAWISGKTAADLGSLLGLATGKKAADPRGCWPADDDRSSTGKRRCWPDPSDLPSGDPTPADVIGKIIRSRRR